MKYLIVIILFQFAKYTYSQSTTFHKYYGGVQEEYGYAFTETLDGGFVVCGRTFSSGVGGWDGYVIRLNADGDTLWTKSYGNIQYDEIQDIDITSDGGFIVTGHTWTTDWAGDIYLIKLDATGNIMWDQTYGGASGLSDKGYSVQETLDGGYIISGTTESYGAGGDDLYVIKTSSTGALQWTRTVGSSGTSEAGREIQQTSDGGYIVTGYTDGPSGFLDVLLVKLSSSGLVQWSKVYGGSSYDFAYSVQETIDNGFILGATTNSFGAGSWDAYLIKVSSNGSLQWSKTYGLGGEDRLQSVRQTDNGGYILCGRSNTFGFGDYDATLLKTDDFGNLQWAKSFGGPLEDQAWFVGEYSTGGFIVCGYAYSFGAGSRDLFMIKTDPNGISGCNEISGNLVTNNPNTSSSSFGSFSSGGIVNTVPVIASATGTFVTVQCDSVDCQIASDFYTNDTLICEGGTIIFTNNSTGASAYQWVLDGVPFSNSVNTSNTYNTSGVSTMLLIATNGYCADSSVATIVIKNPSSGIDTQVACDGFTWIDGNTYLNSTNTPTWILTNAVGCDSLVTLDLTITNSSSSSEDITSCDSYTWSADGNIYTSTGTYSTTLTNATGCDSVVTLNLTINTVLDIAISTNGISIEANNSNASSYVWLDCADNFTVINGQTSQSYTPLVSGYYAVQITENDCIDTTDCVSIHAVEIINNSFRQELSLYPNPTDGSFTIDLGENNQSGLIIITDLRGRIISSKKYNTNQFLNIRLEEPAGSYILFIASEDKQARIKLIKK